MRLAALAVTTAVCMTALVGAAAAKDWTDPAGRITFTTPNAWTMENQSQPDMTYLVVGTANNECQFVALPRTETANATAAAVRRAAGNPITAEAWANVGNAMTTLFNNQATVISQSVDTSSFWPVQRADLHSPTHPLVHAAIQIRPGLEIWTFCLTYDGADPAATYDTVIKSVGTSHDAELQTAATQQEADRATAQAAADAAAAAAAAHPQQPTQSRQDEQASHHRH